MLNKHSLLLSIYTKFQSILYKTFLWVFSLNFKIVILRKMTFNNCSKTVCKLGHKRTVSSLANSCFRMMGNRMNSVELYRQRDSLQLIHVTHMY